MGFYEERQKRTQGFLQDRFGMFIHWGLYAIPARGEWVRNQEKISVEDYQQYFEEFDTIYYNPKEWAALAKMAGMKYAVMTTKHHDGFCMFDSRYTDYKCTNTKSGRDFIREYVDAFRAEGIKIGFYYSLLDWHHPDYPHYGDTHHPMRENASYRGQKHDFSNYITYMHRQVEELLTNYGKVDIMWFDFSYGDMSGEKWSAAKLVEMIRRIQPEIVIDNRLIGDSNYTNSFTDHTMPSYAGDFESPEQIIPSGGLKDIQGRDVPWEACMTLNDHWGYCVRDQNYKTPQNVVHMLTECVSKGGNLLLNIGPNAKGEIPKESVKILETVGEWLHENGKSIYCCGKSGLAKPEWGRYTQNGRFLYAHIYERGVASFRLEGLEGKVKKARLLADGSELPLLRPWNAEKYPNDAFVDLGTAELPDPLDTVIELELL